MRTRATMGCRRRGASTHCPMAIHHLVYTSHARAGFNRQDLVDVGASAGKHNPARSITGCLVLCEGRFLQVLEGGLSAINECYQRIAADTRHHGVTLIEVGRTDRRRFGKWSMKWIYAADIAGTAEVVHKYLPEAQFTPELLSGKACVDLLAECAELL